MRFFFDAIEYDHTLSTEWRLKPAFTQKNHMSDQPKNLTRLNRG
jgi:hypothetical protein